MGKSRRNRSGAARKDPIAKAVKAPTDPTLAALREAKILPVIKDLKSPDPKSRSAAASAVSNIIQDTSCRKLLLREQIVHTVLTQTLTDASIESRAAGWGILQVIAREEDADFCIHLFRSDILTALEYATKQVTEKLASTETPYAKVPKAERATIGSIASSIISLTTALAEAGDEILEVISANSTIIRFLINVTTYKSQLEGNEDPIVDLRADTLACLMILCEDNVKFAQDIASSEDDSFYTILDSLKDQATGEGVLACAVLHNIFASLQSSRKPKQKTNNNEDAPLIPTLVKVISSFTADQESTIGSGWSNAADYQQLALETLASIGTSLTASGSSSSKPAQKQEAKTEEGGDDEDMEDAEGSGDEAAEEDAEDAEDGEEGEDDDEMDDDELAADMDMVTGADSEDEDSSDEFPVIKALIQLAIPQLVRIASVQPTNDSGVAMQADALSAINNIAWSLSLFDFSADANSPIRKAWTPAATSIWETIISPVLATDTADLQLATQVTSIAWAIARVLGTKTPLKTDEQRKFITLFGAVRNGASSPEQDLDPFQALTVKCIGVLGQLAQGDCSEALNREVGVFLITVIAGLPQTSPAEAVEALNQIFDVYGDEDQPYDRSVFWANKFLAQLEQAVPKARSMAKSINKKDQSELRLRADEVVMNLTRFLAYKKKHRPAN